LADLDDWLEADLLQGSDGKLHVVYNDSANGKLMLLSDINGNSTSSKIADIGSFSSSESVIDNSGQIHVFYTVMYDFEGGGEGLYHQVVCP